MRPKDRGCGPSPPFDQAYPTYLFQLPDLMDELNTDLKAQEQHARADPSFLTDPTAMRETQKALNGLFTALPVIGRRLSGMHTSTSEDGKLRSSVNQTIEQLKLSNQEVAAMERHIFRMEDTMKTVREVIQTSTDQQLPVCNTSKKAKAQLDLFSSFVPTLEPKGQNGERFSMADYVFRLLGSREVLQYYKSKLPPAEWRKFHRLLVKMRQCESESKMQMIMPWQLAKRRLFHRLERIRFESLERIAMAAHDDRRVLEVGIDEYYVNIAKNLSIPVEALYQNHQKKKVQPVKKTIMKRQGKDPVAMWDLLRKNYMVLLERDRLEQRMFKCQTLTKQLQEELQIEQGKGNKSRFEEIKAALRAQNEVLRTVEEDRREADRKVERVQMYSKLALKEKTRSERMFERLEALGLERIHLTSDVSKLDEEQFLAKKELKRQKEEIAALTEQLKKLGVSV
eukprot:NODE_2561_length_1391_cov_2.573344_g2434_i0.p1 GENE.NODE_2561_length_1391_cov_2.573344_g2434_i0~~NODE_2561_length_1391_cov_2.573344_g2434_i0.p1  ORF type:complete len:454 (+),score=105.02 NODE_2561_length_1391_cov_2.573344_g2434_i0:2-1363(+)